SVGFGGSGAVDLDRGGLQLDGLAFAGGGDEVAFGADAGAGADRGDDVGRDDALVEDDLKVDRRGAVVQLNEVDVLAVAAGFHPPPSDDALAGLPLEESADVLVGLDHCASSLSK